MTSFSQLHLSHNSCSEQSLDQINLHLQDDLSRKLKDVKNFQDFCRKMEMENFKFKEMHVGEKSTGKS